jgi:HAD superfamily hydrolase (TIGR01484 family)
MSDYKAIIFDLDGTAIPNTPDGQPSARLIESVNNNKQKIKLCAATGRSLSNAKYIINALDLNEPCVIAAGTQIYDPSSDKILWEKNIETDDLEKVMQVLRSYDYELIMRESLQGEGAPASRQQIEGAVNVMYLMSCRQPDADIIMEKLAAVSGITAAGVRSWTAGNIDIHITHRDATKEHAIAELLQILGVDKSQTIGVGDSNNDVHLFKSVGRKVAMGNSTDLLKSQADEVCGSVSEDGLAELIDKYAGD